MESEQQSILKSLAVLHTLNHQRQMTTTTYASLSSSNNTGGAGGISKSTIEDKHSDYALHTNGQRITPNESVQERNFYKINLSQNKKVQDVVIEEVDMSR
jgi:hypothetical protein